MRSTSLRLHIPSTSCPKQSTVVSISNLPFLSTTVGSTESLSQYTTYVLGPFGNSFNNGTCTRDRSIAHSLQRWVSTKSSISQLECIFIFMIQVSTWTVYRDVNQTILTGNIYDSQVRLFTVSFQYILKVHAFKLYIALIIYRISSSVVE